MEINPCLLVTIVTRLTQWLTVSPALNVRGETHPLPEAPNKLPTCLARHRRSLPKQLVLFARN